jgi:mono/diheme cytochrome c family protein
VSRVGRCAAALAVILALVTVVTWSRGDHAAGGSVAVSGADLFAAKGCATCHTGPDSEARVSIGPPLDRASEWAGTRRPGMTAAAYLAESIGSPAVFISPAFHAGDGPATGMPELLLSDAEIDALVNYLLTR